MRRIYIALFLLWLFMWAGFLFAGIFIAPEQGRWYSPAEWHNITETRQTIQAFAGLLIINFPLIMAEIWWWKKRKELRLYES